MTLSDHKLERSGPTAMSQASPERLLDYRLDDNLTAQSGPILISGTQALVRLTLMQARLDRAHGWNTAGFVSGYRGSPLGGVDQALWKAQALLDEHKVRFMPAINEELAAAAALGTQRVASDPQRQVEGVFSMWYGKGPGVDRAGDTLRHGNAYGASPRGGVLVVAGDDHGCVSSGMPFQSDLAMQAWSVPVLHPANVAEYLEFGLYGWALSRFSGAWVGFKAIKELEESGVIRRHVALADREKLGLSICVLAHVSLVRHSEGAVEQFERMVATSAEIIECQAITGEADYVIKVVAADMKGYDQFLQGKIFKVPGVASVRSNVVLREVKYETALPVA